MSDQRGPGIVSGLVQAGLTFMIATFAAQVVMESGGPIVIGQGIVAAMAMVAVGGASIALWAWRKRRSAGLTTGQMLAQRLEEVERRESEVDAVHARLAELEERLDFSERLLMKHESPETVRQRTPV
jgi:hypothetical protein